MSLLIGCPAATEWHENRVAVTPEVVGRLGRAGLDVVVEAGAGQEAGFPDETYVASGARIAERPEVFAQADILAVIHRPDFRRLRPGQIVIGLLRPDDAPEELADVTALSFEGLPRTLSRAQSMDVLTSQANVAGYKAAVLAADTFGGFFPMMMTAAGTVRPAKVLVLGGGVAGLQAMGTARRLGALVTGYDVREAAQTDIASTGAAVLDLGVSASGEGGYARALTAEEEAVQQRAMVDAIRGFDVVITTAQVPGHRPPELVSAQALAGMAAGSVVVDLGAGPLGGNVAGSVPDGRTVTENGVVVLGAGDLPAQVARAASSAWARNVTALLEYLIHDGSVVLDPDDEITAGLLVHPKETVS
ncbi:NAD(P) transhydrogenase subunit alpha [Kribbella sindirgiensis]|uniref:proton-translocating NAD(P)(+) transhydrogenase n=1 Tax=Kribbella sindirgiensis TaxID=1124744 RepID=A0A4V2M1F9_9ACTN|nr:NAD(P) transhydrogenase subunit alpha [Kribbella sindirgiensis]TCC16041.1 NAD(P) transhydrogenase subunit alpha [Kribbella sindirgiensis]